MLSAQTRGEASPERTATARAAMPSREIDERRARTRRRTVSSRSFQRRGGGAGLGSAMPLERAAPGLASSPHPPAEAGEADRAQRVEERKGRSPATLEVARYVMCEAIAEYAPGNNTWSVAIKRMIRIAGLMSMPPSDGMIR